MQTHGIKYAVIVAAFAGLALYNSCRVLACASPRPPLCASHQHRAANQALYLAVAACIFCLLRCVGPRVLAFFPILLSVHFYFSNIFCVLGVTT